jgi:hypothetical protein
MIDGHISLSLGAVHSGKSTAHTGANDCLSNGSFWTTMEVYGTELLSFAIQGTTDKNASTEMMF